MILHTNTFYSHASSLGIRVMHPHDTLECLSYKSTLDMKVVCQLYSDKYVDGGILFLFFFLNHIVHTKGGFKKMSMHLQESTIVLNLKHNGRFKQDSIYKVHDSYLPFVL